MKTKIPNVFPNILGIYIRVSTQVQASEGVSLEVQLENGKKKAKELGWNYVIYDDSALSGKLKIDHRVGMKQLMYDLQECKLGGVYVFNVDRLSRDNDFTEGQIIISRFKEMGVRVFSHSEGEIDLKNPTIEFGTRMKSFIASYEGLNRSASIRSSLLYSMNKGNNASGGPLQPYGYDKLDKKLVINEKESKIIRKIFEMYIKGHGTFSIANYLNEQKIPTKRMSPNIEKGYLFRNKKGKRNKKEQTQFKWRDAVVLKILHNPLYKGEKQFKGKFRNEAITIPCPIIIEPEIFDKVQLTFKEKMKFKKTPNNVNEYLLKGLIVCGECGKPFYGKKREDLKDNAYVCLSQRNKGEYCGNFGINIDFLDNLVWKQMGNMDKSVIKYFDELKKDDNVSVSQTYIKEGERRIKEITDEKISLLKKYNNDKVNKKDFELLNSDYDSRLERIKAGIEQAKRKISLFLEKDSVIKNIQTYLKPFKTKSSFTFEEKQNYVRGFVKNIIISKTKKRRPSPIFSDNDKDVFIEFKIDSLTDFRLSKEIQVGYKPNGHRTGLTKEDIRITKFLNDAISQTRMIPGVYSGISHKPGTGTTTVKKQ